MARVIKKADARPVAILDAPQALSPGVTAVNGLPGAVRIAQGALYRHLPSRERVRHALV
jgi:hypothetical protein